MFPSEHLPRDFRSPERTNDDVSIGRSAATLEPRSMNRENSSNAEDVYITIFSSDSSEVNGDAEGVTDVRSQRRTLQRQ